MKKQVHTPLNLKYALASRLSEWYRRSSDTQHRAKGRLLPLPLMCSQQRLPADCGFTGLPQISGRGSMSGPVQVFEHAPAGWLAAER